MDIIAVLPNPEIDLKTPRATDVDVFVTLLGMVAITIIFIYIRTRDNKK